MRPQPSTHRMRFNDDSQFDIRWPEDLSYVNDPQGSDVSNAADDEQWSTDRSTDSLAPLPEVGSEVDGEDRVLSERTLVARVRSGDQTACELLVRQYGPRMLNAARRLLDREADAHDAVQDAFLSAFRTIDAFEGRSQLGSWLYRIVVNASLMRLRTRRRRKERSIDDLLPKYNDIGTLSDHLPCWRRTQDDAVEMRETRDLVRENIAELPEPYRTVLLLRDIEELDTEETAETLGISPAAVRTRLHRARQALKSLLDEHMTELPT